MRYKKKIIVSFIIIIIIALGSLNVYQLNKISNYKEDLTFLLWDNLGQFAARGGNKNIETLQYARLVANIESAQDLYTVLSERKGFPSDEYDRNLGGLLMDLSFLMNNDKEKFEEFFSGSEIASLMYKISNNFEDVDSIKEVYDALNIQIEKL